MYWVLGLLAVVAVGVLAWRGVRRAGRQAPIEEVDLLLEDIEHAKPSQAPFQHPELDQTMPAVLALLPERSTGVRGRGRSHDPDAPSDFD
jgi:hypothetical protein